MNDTSLDNLDAINSRINDLYQNMCDIRQRTSDFRARLLGETPSEGGGCAARPMRSGLVGTIHDRLDDCFDTVNTINERLSQIEGA